MLKYCQLAFVVLLLQGCWEPAVSEKTPMSVAVEPVSHFALNAIALEKGSALKVEGRIVRYDLLRNKRGEFDRYIIESPLQQMGLEGAVFWELARKGYVRKVRKDEAGRYMVNYVLNGQATLSAEYRAWNENGAKSRLVITRKALVQ